MLNDTYTKGTAGDIRNSYLRRPQVPLVWEKWLCLECQLNSEGKYMGEFDGNKLQSATFSLNFGCQMEPIFDPLHTSDFQNCACRSSRKQNFEKLSKNAKGGMSSRTQFKKKCARHDDTQNLRWKTQFRFFGGGPIC